MTSQTQYKLVILESPFAGDTVGNIQYARRCVRDCAFRGEATQASHLYYTQRGILDDDKPEERKLGIELGLAWKRVADYSVYYTDRGWSKGMLDALREDRLSGRKFYIRALDGDPGTAPTTYSLASEAA